MKYNIGDKFVYHLNYPGIDDDDDVACAVITGVMNTTSGNTYYIMSNGFALRSENELSTNKRWELVVEKPDPLPIPSFTPGPYEIDGEEIIAKHEWSKWHVAKTYDFCDQLQLSDKQKETRTNRKLFRAASEMFNLLVRLAIEVGCQEEARAEAIELLREIDSEYVDFVLSDI